MYSPRSRFSRYYFLTSFTIIFLITIGVGAYLVLGKYKEFKQYTLKNKITIIENKKQLMKDLVDSYVDQVGHIIALSDVRRDETMKNRVRTAHRIATNLYNSMKDTSTPDEVKSAIKSALSGMVFGHEYLFAFDVKGEVISSPVLKSIEGKNLINVKDPEGRYTLRDSIDVIRKSSEGFNNIYWVNPLKPDEGPQKKVVFLKHFEPYDWVLGFGYYKEDYEEQTKKKVIKQLEAVRYENDGYLFVATYDGVSLGYPEKVKGKNMYNVQDVNGKYIVRELISRAKEGGGFVEYVMPSFSDSTRHETKLSYSAPVKHYDWYVGTGMYITDIEAEYEARISDLFASEKREITLIICGLVALIAVGGVAVYIFSGRLQNLVDKYSEELNVKNEELSALNANLEGRVAEKTSELNRLNQSLEQRVEEEVSKNREKDRIMFQQGRLAAMGEMIANIAHQWRQPLSSISLIVQDIQEAYSFKELDEKYIAESVNRCTGTIQHMSDTIDNFRYFFKPEKDKVEFSTSEELKRCLRLVDASLENNDIKVRTDFQSEGFIYGVSGEYSQVIVNIINNAKDVLLAGKTENPEIKIRSYNENDSIIVEISDNGGGVPEEIIERVFEPYFTTKDKKQGTGIGLYFSKMIIDNNMGGKLSVYNTDSGACFVISVPMSK